MLLPPDRFFRFQILPTLSGLRWHCAINKKIDPRKLQFGSKINGDSRQRQDYHSVKKVISSTELELEDGLLPSTQILFSTAHLLNYSPVLRFGRLWHHRAAI
jgi:hypothetical protein